ncbi:MAG TPA: methionine aminopeptidase [Dermatophilaceae bacterium]|nr:methionine aminopeptidase [Dermatophilaceae bacterium]
MPFWFNVVTKAVETDQTRSRGDDVMGPYDTEAEARRAFEIAAARTEQWDEEDRRWNEEGRRS